MGGDRSGDSSDPLKLNGGKCVTLHLSHLRHECIFFPQMKCNVDELRSIQGEELCFSVALKLHYDVVCCMVNKIKHINK